MSLKAFIKSYTDSMRSARTVTYRAKSVPVDFAARALKDERDRHEAAVQDVPRRRLNDPRIQSQFGPIEVLHDEWDSTADAERKQVPVALAPETNVKLEVGHIEPGEQDIEVEKGLIIHLNFDFGTVQKFPHSLIVSVSGGAA